MASVSVCNGEYLTEALFGQRSLLACPLLSVRISEILGPKWKEIPKSTAALFCSDCWSLGMFVVAQNVCFEIYSVWPTDFITGKKYNQPTPCVLSIKLQWHKWNNLIVLKLMLTTISLHHVHAWAEPIYLGAHLEMGLQTVKKPDSKSALFVKISIQSCYHSSGCGTNKSKFSSTRIYSHLFIRQSTQSL